MTNEPSSIKNPSIRIYEILNRPLELILADYLKNSIHSQLRLRYYTRKSKRERREGAHCKSHTCYQILNESSKSEGTNVAMVDEQEYNFTGSISR